MVHIDVPMPMGYATLELAKQLQLLEPFGVGNSKPLFAQKDVQFVGARRIGANGNFARFSVLVERNGQYRREELMYFGNLEKFCNFLDEKYGRGQAAALFEGRAQCKISITYQIGVNSYRGNESLQYIMQNYS